MAGLIIREKSIQILKRLKEDIRDHIIQQNFNLPLYSSYKQFDFDTLRYQNYCKQQIVLNLVSIINITRMLQIVEIAIDHLQKGQCITKRNLYYKLIQYYKQYHLLDNDIDFISFNVKLSREALGILSSSRCIIAGDISVKLDDNQFVCRPNLITNFPTYQNLSQLKTKCKKLVILEKQSALFQIYQKCIKLFEQQEKDLPKWYSQTMFISSKGYPDNTTRSLIQALWEQMECIYYIGDRDIYGVDIMLNYVIGYNNFRTFIHKMRWVHFDSMLQKQSVKQQFQVLGKQDKIKIMQLLHRKYFQDIELFQPANQLQQNFRQTLLVWKSRLIRIRDINKKIELEAIFKFLPDQWLEDAICCNRYSQ